MASLKGAVEKAQRNGRLGSGIKHPWMSQNNEEKIEAESSVIVDRNQCVTDKPTDKLTDKPTDKPTDTTKTNKKRCLALEKIQNEKNIEDLINLIAGTKKLILVFLFRRADKKSGQTKRITIAEAIEELKIKKSTFQKTCDRLYQDGIFEREGLKTFPGGTFYTLNKKIFASLKKMEADDEGFFHNVK